MVLLLLLLLWSALFSPKWNKAEKVEGRLGNREKKKGENPKIIPREKNNRIGHENERYEKNNIYNFPSQLQSIYANLTI